MRLQGGEGVARARTRTWTWTCCCSAFCCCTHCWLRPFRLLRTMATLPTAFPNGQCRGGARACDALALEGAAGTRRQKVYGGFTTAGAPLSRRCGLAHPMPNAVGDAARPAWGARTSTSQQLAAGLERRRTPRAPLVTRPLSLALPAASGGVGTPWHVAGEVACRLAGPPAWPSP